MARAGRLARGGRAAEAGRKIGAFGVSINDHQPGNGVELVRSGHVDTVQVIYNAFDQSPEDELFPAVQEANVGVIVRVPFDEGALTGRIRPDTEFPEGDFRHDYFRGDRKQQVWERAQALAADLGVTSTTSRRRRCASRHAPGGVDRIPGMRSVRNVERNVAAVEARPARRGAGRAVRPHRWERNFYRELGRRAVAQCCRRSAAGSGFVASTTASTFPLPIR